MSECVVMITGALAGIGRATATAFAREGAAVVVSGRRDEEGQAFVAELQGVRREGRVHPDRRQHRGRRPGPGR
jgi:NADP-dependent 3-hydroxy acid dehydrogenase YdfG